MSEPDERLRKAGQSPSRKPDIPDEKKDQAAGGIEGGMEEGLAENPSQGDLADPGGSREKPGSTGSKD